MPNVFDNLGMGNKTPLQQTIFWMSFQEVILQEIFSKDVFSECVSQSYSLAVMASSKKLFVS